MVFTVCPSCGIASEHPHDSQEACIEALHSEIEKTRQLLAAVDAAPTAPREQAPERQDVQTT